MRLLYCLLSLTFLSGCTRHKEPARCTTLYVLDLQADAVWKSSHSVSISWRVRQYDLPLVVRKSSNVTSYKMTLSLTDDVPVLIASGDELRVDASPLTPLYAVGVDSFVEFDDSSPKEVTLVNYNKISPQKVSSGVDLTEDEISKWIPSLSVIDLTEASPNDSH